MTHWMCIKCGYYFKADQPPNRCPGCNEACAFNDVTCYRPECGGEKNVDPLLVGASLRTLSPRKPGVIHKTTTTATVALESSQRIDVLNGLNDKQKQKVLKLGSSKTFHNNEVICHEDDKSVKLYLIERGEVLVKSQLGTGMPIRSITINTGQYFGWSSLVPPYKLVATVTAINDVQVLGIEQSKMTSLMQQDPAIGLMVMQNIARIISSRLHDLQREFVVLAQQLGH